jgi:PAS domain S-box-containing protein
VERSDDPISLIRGLAFEHSPVALSLLNLDGTQLDANHAYTTLMGVDAASLAQLSAHTITHPDHRERTSRYLAQLASGEVDEVVTEKWYVRPDGSTFEARLTARPLRDASGSIVAILGAIHDLTEQAVFDQAQRQLEARQAVADVAATTAHELNNLLGAMTLHLDLAEPGSATHGLRDLLERATMVGAELLRLTNDRLETTPSTQVVHDTTPGDDRSAVLVVDDEPTLLDTVALALRRSGYDVLAAADGTEALELAASHHIGVLVTDLMMPGMDGVDLASRLRAEQPDLPVLFITGYAGGDLSLRLPDDANVLRKPFRALDLVTSVARLHPMAS